MNTQLYVFLMGLAALLLLRTLIWLRLMQLLTQARNPWSRAHHLLQTHGSTVGQLQDAGVYEELGDLKSQAGKLYRQAVPLAAALMWWPLGPWFRKNAMAAAYDKVGMAKGAWGSLEAWRDVCKGSAKDTKYYPVEHMDGMLASLQIAGPFF